VVENPLKVLLADWLPEFDFGVMSHGFAPHGRDYVLLLQAGATYEVTLTHVVAAHYETRVADEVWPISWDDVLTDYGAWEAAGAPDGYVWGSNWSLAHPGLSALDIDPLAASWAARVGKPMYAASIETDRFKLSIIFHAARAKKLSDDGSVVGRMLNPMMPAH
jgi:hypothetical protein